MKLPLLLVIISTALLLGCATSPFDSRTAEDVRELTRRTNEVVADGDAGRLSLAQSRKFLQQSQAQVQVMQLRGMGDTAQPMLSELNREYAALLQHDRPLRRHTTSKLRGALLALESMSPAHSLRPASTASASTSDDITDTSTTDTSSKKDCDKDQGHDHGGHDSGGHHK